MEPYCEACIFGRGKHNEDCEHDAQLNLEHSIGLIDAMESIVDIGLMTRNQAPLIKGAD